MISLLVYIVIIIIIFGLLGYAIQMLPIQPPFKNIAYIILVLILILILLSLIGVLPPLAGAPHLQQP